MKKSLTTLTLLFVAVLFTVGCTRQTAPNNHTENSSMPLTTPSPFTQQQDPTTPVPTISTSTEVSDIEVELNQTQIETEDFSNL